MNLLRCLCLWGALWSVVAQGQALTGPTIHLVAGNGVSDRNPVSDFMYFVPLISVQPLASVTSRGSTQEAHMVGVAHRTSGSGFVTTCDFEFDGRGLQESLVDIGLQIHKRERELKAGGSMQRQLKSIVVNGGGAISVEVEGVMSNGVRVVTEVRLRFNARGGKSPVSITLCDVHWADGKFRSYNEVVATVNALTFRRTAAVPKMEVSVASIKDKDVGDSMWQNFKGTLKGAAVNLFLPPIVIEETGNHAILDFGLAVVAGEPTFTFPHAKNLIVGRIPEDPFR
ncbi:MAG TPA: hypothetical protein VHB20_17360 [Verrucomicrobiae bacterium]|jgi:hypothetical protein|nr:hypothetical protein [Verrucomicrobiae bacterium]